MFPLPERHNLKAIPLNAVHDNLALPLDDYPLRRGLNPVEVAPESAQKALEKLLGDLLLLDVPALDSLLQRREDICHGVGLGEDTSGGVSLAFLGADVVWCAVCSEEELACAGNEGVQESEAVVGSLNVFC